MSATPPHPPPAAQIILLQYAATALLSTHALNTLVHAAPHGIVYSDNTTNNNNVNNKTNAKVKQEGALVPPELLDSMLQSMTMQPPSASLVSIQTTLAAQLHAWRQVVVAQVVDLAPLVRATLDTAATAAASQGKEQHATTIHQAAATLVACCAAQSACFDAWVGRHKHALRGSAAMLQTLASTQAAWAPLRATRACNARFRTALEALRTRNAQLLSTSKGWQREAAGAADDACAALLGGGRGAGGGGGSTGGALVMTLVVLLLPVVMVIVRHDARVRAALRHAWSGSDRALTMFDSGFDEALAAVEHHVDRGWALVGPHVKRGLVLMGPSLEHVQQVSRDMWGHVEGMLKQYVE